MSEPHVITSPKYAGYWEIGGPTGLRVALAHRPIWLHRWTVKLVLGFIWKDGSVSDE